MWCSEWIAGQQDHYIWFETHITNFQCVVCLLKGIEFDYKKVLQPLTTCQ